MNTVKPLFRGYSHQAAFFTALGACIMLILKAEDTKAIVASIIYSLGVLILFGMSATYHRIQWSPKVRNIIGRLDLCAIYIMIACTFTPICLFALPEDSGHLLLIIVWIVAILGLLQSLLFVNTPKWVSAVLYVIFGYLAAPYYSEIVDKLGWENFLFLLAGGIAYTIGAVMYALKRPQLVPHIFGYHEIFHIFVIIGAALHFKVIYYLISN